MFRFVDYIRDLKARLNKRGILAAELARAAKMDHAQLSRLLAGKNAPSLRTVERLETALEKLSRGKLDGAK